MAIESQEEFQKFLESAFNKVREGARLEELDDEEKEALQLYQQERAGQMAKGQGVPEDVMADHKKRAEALNMASTLKDSRNFLKITDTHVESSTLERILMKVKSDHGVPLEDKLGKWYAVLHPGDMLPDFFSGSQDFTAKEIISKGKLEGDEKERFACVHNYILGKIGIDNRLLESGQVDAGKLMSHIMSFYGGENEPEGLTRKELEEFRSNREKGKNILKKAFYQYAVDEYKKQREVYDKHVDLESMLTVPGNHDHIKAFYEVFGDIALKPGGKKKVHGVTYGASLIGGTGNFLGTTEDMGFGILDSKDQAQNILLNTKSLNNYYEHINASEEKGGLDLAIDKHAMLRYFEKSKERVRMGFDDAFFDFMNNEAIKEMDDVFAKKLGKIPETIQDDVDVFFGHGNPNGQYAGMDENALNKLLMDLTSKKGDILYVHGHEHADTTHALKGAGGNVYYLNSGASASGHSARVYLDENNKFKAGLVFKRDKDGRLDYDLYDKESMPPQKYRKAA